MGNVAVIDGSLLAFRAAAAGEKRTIIATHTASGRKKDFKNRTEFKDYLSELNEARGENAFAVTDFTIEEIQTPIPVEQSLHIAKELLQYILTACDATEYEIYLDEGETFRHRLATVQRYKGDRIGKAKPVNLQAVKDYLVLHHGAVVCRGIEADDKINMRKFEGYIANKAGVEDKIISVSFDKDDMGNPGWSFDFRKDEEGIPLMKEPIWIDGLGELRYRSKQRDCKGQGRKFFYYQVLDEDKADCYRGRKLSGKRYSAKKAYDDLNPCKTDKECLEVLVKRYKEWYPEPKDYTSWDGKELTATWQSMLQEHWDMARMLRWDDDEVKVMDVLDRLGIDYESED